MNEFSINNLADKDQERLLAIAKELAGFGLGIYRPHMHAEDGTVMELPDTHVSFENNLNVSFTPRKALPLASYAVGWRYTEGLLTSFAYCCGDPDPDPDPDPSPGPWIVANKSCCL